MTDNMVFHSSPAVGFNGLGVPSNARASGRVVAMQKLRGAEESSFYINPACRPPKPFQLALKRAMDIVGSLFGLVVLAPLFLLIAALVKLESRGPVFFRQIRTGLNDVPFEILKFRSMYLERCDLSGVSQTTDNDPRITRLGKIFLVKPTLMNCRSFGMFSSAICRWSGRVRTCQTCWPQAGFILIWCRVTITGT